MAPKLPPDKVDVATLLKELAIATHAEVGVAKLSVGVMVTERLTVLVAVPLVAPVPVTVCVVADCVAVGMPLMTPVVASINKPVGNPGLMP
jgi:hypothetical protein